MLILVTLVLSVASSSVTAAAVSFMLERRRVTWNAKREACLDALEIVNGLFSHVTWNENGKDLPVLEQDRPRIADIRRCHNELAFMCRDPEVLANYLRCFNFRGSSNGNLPGDAVDDLRDAVRRELGLKKVLIRNREWSFIGSVDQAVTETPGERS